MEKCVFTISSYDKAALLPQVSRILEKRTELVSRGRLPGAWKVIDGINSTRKTAPVPKPHSKVYGIILIALGIFLFVPGVMKPGELLVPLIAGAFGILAGVLSLLRGRKPAQNPFDKSAALFLDGRDTIPEGQTSQVTFSDAGFTVITQSGTAPVETSEVSYADVEYIIESDDLLGITYNEQIIVLQKKDMVEGDVSDLSEFFSGTVSYHSLTGSAGA